MEENQSKMPDQLSEVLMIMDTEEMKLLTPKEFEGLEKGKAKTTEVDDNNDFLKIDKNSNLLENFILNFQRQAKNPTKFQFFRVPVNAVKNFVKNFNEFVKGKSDAKNKLEQYKVSDTELIEKNLKEKKEMAKQTNDTEKSTTDYKKFNPALVDISSLESLGLSKQYLEQKGLWDQMLKGNKTNELVPIKINTDKFTLSTEARLSLQYAGDGKIKIAVHGRKREPELLKPYFGHVFSPEDKKNLSETGNLGRTVPLTFRGETKDCFISLDKLTNDIVACQVESIRIPQEFGGVKLTEQEINELKEGKAIQFEGEKNGKAYNCTLQFNADLRRIEPKFENEGLITKISGTTLNQEQIADINNGKPILVEGIKGKFGEYDTFAKVNEVTGKVEFTKYNPDNPTEIIIPKEILGVKLTDQDRLDLKENRPIFLENMIGKNGEEFSSFVKLDPSTGRTDYSKKPDGFDDRPKFEIPKEIQGEKLTAQQRATLQDGKTVELKINTSEGKVPLFIKLNPNGNKLDFFNQNPDLKKQNTTNKEMDKSKKQEAADKPNKKTTKSKTLS